MPELHERQLMIPPLETRAAFVPSSFNKADRTVELVWTTGQRTLKAPHFEEPFLEQLSLEAGAVRLERLNTGAPLLNGHGRGDYNGGMPGLSDQIGVVENARIEGTRGLATVRFSGRPEVASIVADVADGIIQGVSFGYRVHRWRDITEPGDTHQVRLAVDWEPFELTLLPIPADSGTSIRAASSTNPCVLELRASTQGEPMPTPEPKTTQVGTTPAAPAPRTPEPAPAAPVVAAPAAPLETRAPAAPLATAAPVVAAPAPLANAANDAVLAERTRGLEIRSLCTSHGMDAAFAENLVTTGATMDSARSAVLDGLATRDSASPTASHIAVVRDGADAMLPAMQQALEHRCGLATELGEHARQYRNMSLVRMAEESLRTRGLNVGGMSQMELAQRSLLSTSDLPFIFANVANKSLRKAYEASPRTWEPFARRSDAPDFKTVSRVQLGEAPALDVVNEAGEFTRGTIGEARETYALVTRGKILAFTRQAMVNDDLSALDRMPQLFGRAASEAMSDVVWALITSNVVMGDGVALFAGGHSNTGSGIIGTAGLGAGRSVMRLQTGINGQRINVTPRFLVVPAALETLAQQNTFLVNPANASDVNPFARVFQSVIAEPRLDADSAVQWYMFADPAQIDVLEYAFLQGSDGPVLETREGFDVDGMELKARLDFGAAMLDHRGAYRSSGV